MWVGMLDYFLLLLFFHHWAVDVSMATVSREEHSPNKEALANIGDNAGSLPCWLFFLLSSLSLLFIIGKLLFLCDLSKWRAKTHICIMLILTCNLIIRTQERPCWISPRKGHLVQLLVLHSGPIDAAESAQDSILWCTCILVLLPCTWHAHCTCR